MTFNAIIETVVKLITANELVRAVAMWKDVCCSQGNCELCFYAPLDEDIRCASCLESHRANAQLRRLYPSMDEAEIAQAKQNLKVWLADAIAP